MSPADRNGDGSLADQRSRVDALAACEDRAKRLRDRETDLEVEQMAADDELRSALEGLMQTHLGSPLSVGFRSDDGTAGGVPDPLVGEADDPEIVDIEADLTDEAAAPDPADLVIDLLGGEVVTD